MRLALILLAVAAGLSFLSTHINAALFERDNVVAAQRARAAPETTGAATHPAPGLAYEAMASPLPLFRTLQAVDTTPTPGERFELVGLAGQPGARIAMLRDAASGATHNVRVNDQVGAWHIVEIEERCVRMRREQQDIRPCLP